MKAFTKGMLLAGLMTLITTIAAGAQGRLIERKSPDAEPATDQEFLAKAININMSEIKMAELAEKEATNKDVRAFAKNMIADHTKLNKQAMTMAKSMRVAVATSPPPAMKEKMATLAKLRGADFDREYMTTQIMAHEKALKMFTTWAKKAKDSELRELASKAADEVKEHLKMAKEVQAKLKGS